MATINLIIKGETELSTIFVRVYHSKKSLGGFDVVASTGYTVKSTPKPKESQKTGKTILVHNVDKVLNDAKNTPLKIQLEKLKTKILESLNNDKGTGAEINKAWLELVIAKFKNPQLEEKTEYLKDLIEAYQTEMKTKINPKTGKPISHLTIKSFSTTLMRLKKFEEYKNKRFSISDIDLTFKNEFVKYESEKLLISQNSISKDIRQIKTVCLDANDKGFSISEQVRSRKFYIKEEQTAFVTLSESEIELIKKCDLKKVNYLENARDWLIIGCWTGCRVNDLMQLTNDNIQITTQGQKFIRYTQSKTNKQVDIPIHSDVNEILERLGDFPRPISDQRFNEWIKKVCFQCGLVQEIHGSRQNPETHRKEVGTFKKWELVRSHTCRRSFATNHYNKLPNKLIMAVTGHATEKMLLNYIGETENDHLDDFLSVWNTPKVKDEKIIQLNEKQA